MRKSGIGKIVTDKAGVIREINIKLSGSVFQEGKLWTAHCRELDLASCGDTKEDALKNVGEATRLFFISCIERGTLGEALTELGWRFSKPKLISQDSFWPSIPPPFNIEQHKNDDYGWYTNVSLAA